MKDCVSVFALLFTIFIVSVLIGMEINDNHFRNKIKEHAVEYDYAHYNQKTGDLVIDNEYVKELLNE